MDSDVTSMLKAVLESQQREMSWNPTSHHSFESSSTYQEEGFPNGYSSQEYHYECDDGYPYQEYQEEYSGYSYQEYQNGYQNWYGDGYQSWSMEYEYEATHPPQDAQIVEPSYENEKVKDLLKLVLERQEEFNKRMMTSFDDILSSPHFAGVTEPTHEENTQTQDECLQEDFIQEDSLQEAEEMMKILEEFEHQRGTLLSSQIHIEEENYNLMKLILEEQEKFNESLCMYDTNLDARTQDSKIFETTHVESIKTELTQWIEEEEGEGNTEEPFEDPCKDGLNVEEQESLIEEAPEGNEEEEKSAEEIVKEFELLLGCTIGEDLVIRYEEEDDHKPIMKHSTKIFKGMKEEDSPMTQHLNMHPGIISTTSPSYQGPRKTPFKKFRVNEFRVRHCDSPKKIPFEEIRMNEFRGWFYDEYDPGDPNSIRTPT